MATPAEIVIAIRSIDQASTAIKSVSGSLGGLEASAVRTGRALATIGVAAAVTAVGGLALGLGKAVTAASDFEHTMSGVSAVSGASAAEMAQLSAAAIKLGADTKFSATEAGRGIEELVKAGVSIGDVLGGAAAASLNLAAAGEIDVASSAQIAANAMNAFNLKGADMAHVADVIAGAANASAIDVNDFKFSLAASGAVASLVGFSFDDLATAIAVMGQAGIKGSDAGTSLKTMMLNLQPATKKQKELFQELGLVTAEGANKFFDATGKVRSMAEVAGVLQTALAGMSEQQKLATLEVLFGSDAIRASAVLANAGAEGFNEMAAAMSKVTAESVANERLNNLQGSMEKLRGSLETAAIAIGVAFLPALRQIVDATTELVNNNMPALESGAMAMADAFTAALPAMVQFFQTLVDNRDTIATVAAGLAAFIVINTVVQAITGFIAAVTALGGALSTVGAVIGAVVAILGGPITLVITALILVVAALAAAWATDWNGIRETTASAVDAIGALVQTIIEFFTNLPAAILTAWETIQAGTDAALVSLAAAIQGAWDGVLATIKAALDAIGIAVIAAWEAVFNVATRAALADLLAAMTEAWTLITTLIQTALTTISTAIQTAWTTIQTTIQTALTAIQSAIQTAWTAIQTAIETAMTAVKAAIDTGWAAVLSATQTALAGVLSAISEKIADAVRVVQDGMTRIVAAVQGIVGSARSAASEVGSAIISGIADAINAGVQRVANAAANAVRRAISAARAAAGGGGGGDDDGRAMGGPVSAGRQYLVGEHGPELFVPGVSGNIIPNYQLSSGASGGSTMAGSGGDTIQIIINAPIYGVNDMEDVVIRALDRAGRRGRV